MSGRWAHSGNGIKEALTAMAVVGTVMTPLCAAMWWFHAQPESAVARKVLPALLLLYVLVGVGGSTWAMQRKREKGQLPADTDKPPPLVMRPMKPWRTVGTFFLVGMALWAIGFLPLGARWFSVEASRAWAVAVMGYLALVGPVAGLVVGLGAVAAQSASATGWTIAVGILALGAVVNGFTWALGALVVEWARHRARTLFAVLVGLLSSYWTFGLMIVVAICLG